MAPDADRDTESCEPRAPVSCRLCGSTEGAVVFRSEGLDIIECAGCGVVFTATQPTEDALLDIYDREYFSGESACGMDFIGGRSTEEYDASRFGGMLDMLEGYGVRPGRLLDVGCATGNLLMQARSRGWEVAGCEISAEAAAYAAERGLDVFGGPLRDVPFDKGSFDAVTLNHVLEHIPDPVDFLREGVLPLMASGGLLYVEVPNFESVHARAAGPEWDGLQPRQHLFHFRRSSLARLLEGLELEVLTVTSLPEPQTRVLGPLVYLGVAVGGSQRAGRETVLRRSLRRIARAISMPIARWHAWRGREVRLVAVARRAGSG